MTKVQYLLNWSLSSFYRNLNCLKLQNPCVCRNYCQGNIKCWKCGVDKISTDIFCNACNVVQKPPNTNNYFKILRINESYDIDTKKLTNNFRNLQNQLHPDKYSNRPQEEKDISQDYSSIINQAYRNLLSPIERGTHLLSLKGEEITENENTSNNKEFLMEIMEMNEEVEDADTPEKLKGLEKKSKEILKNISQELTASFNNNDVIEAKKILIRMKYYNSIAKQIHNLLREKGIVD